MQVVVLVLCVRQPYDFQDQNSGRQISGFKMSFALPSPNVNDLGLNVVEKTIPDKNLHSQFAQDKVPGVYDMTVDFEYNNRGLLRDRITGFKYIRPVKMDDLIVK